MEKKNITDVIENNLCFGCGACDTSCPSNAIKFTYTSIGRLLPEIDNKACNLCGICFSVCPGIDIQNIIVKKEINPFYGEYLEAYVGKTFNEEIYNNAQSGGMATEVLSYLFDNENIDAAIVCKMDYAFEPAALYFIARSKEEIRMCQKSIYTPVNLVSALKFTQNYKSIAVIGIPCHIQGIISLQGRNPRKYSNISFLLGLICDQNLSESLNGFLLGMAPIKDKCKIIYKDKFSPDYKNANVTIRTINDIKYEIITASERHFLKSYLAPPRCLLCFDKMNIHADIVFGDPWGIKGIDKEKGESLVITRTKKGQGLIDDVMLSERALLRKVSYQDATTGQGIEKRAQRTKGAIEAYETLGFLTPSYTGTLNFFISDKPAIYNQKEICDYLSLEKKPREAIIRYLKKKVKKKKYKSRVKQIIKTVLLVKLWRK
ncbi:MAG: Coenzyme F420 hydrogenase/dehydrogenase, beta subunit C-terminal domain [Bacteroidales bacterium]|nr:Coenzyme F420 hydrogenase/dehydrogenase, beta subunit C-terminal domain [Bacteroidales bacterium]